MPDREKLMEALKLCANGEPCMGKKYRACPYSPIGKPEYYNCGAAMAAGILALLREQEPVEPHVEHDSDDDSWYYGCGACHDAIDYKDKFCRHCGRGVKWDGDA